MRPWKRHLGLGLGCKGVPLPSLEGPGVFLLPWPPAGEEGSFSPGPSGKLSPPSTPAQFLPRTLPATSLPESKPLQRCLILKQRTAYSQAGSGSLSLSTSSPPPPAFAPILDLNPWKFQVTHPTQCVITGTSPAHIPSLHNKALGSPQSLRLARG